MQAEPQMEALFKEIAGFVAQSVEVLAALIIVAGAIEATWGAFRALLSRQSKRGQRRDIWLRFAVWLLLGLEFELASDIIRTAIPDRSAGLSFLEVSLPGFVPFGIAIGTIVAGGVANRVVYFHRPLETFGYLPLVVAAIVVVLCVGPLCVFVDILTRTRRRGVFQYGALALSLGRHFESKWLAVPSNTPDQILEAPDFSATIDLYSIVANVHEMNAVPFGVKSVSRLVAAALAPVIPLALVALPFDVVAKDVMKFLV